MYGNNNPIRFIDLDGMETDDWVKRDDEYIWDDRVVNQTTAIIYQGEGAEYIGQAATITAKKEDGSSVGSAIDLNSDGTITRDGVTLGQNSDEVFTNATGSTFIPKQTVGSNYDLSMNAALGGGFGVGGGFLHDGTGKWAPYFTFNGNIGFGGGIGLDLGRNIPTGKNQFFVDDFAGNSGSYNLGLSTPIVDFGYGFGGSLHSHTGGLEALKPRNFGANERGYKTEQIGLSPGTGVGGFAMFSYGKTWVY